MFKRELRVEVVPALQVRLDPVRFYLAELLRHVLHEADDCQIFLVVLAVDIEDLKVLHLLHLPLNLHVLADNLVEAVGPLELVEVVASRA